MVCEINARRRSRTGVRLRSQRRTVEPRNRASGHGTPCPYADNCKIKGAQLKLAATESKPSARLPGKKNSRRNYPSGAMPSHTRKRTQVRRSADTGAASVIKR